MGADIKSLRTRIRSVDSTLHLTKAMGLVAASKIRKATRVMNKSREYAAAMDDVVSVLRSSPECERTPYMQPAGEGTRLIVIAGDRGLAGGYNANIFRLAATEPDAEVIPIGKRACEHGGKPFVSSEKFPATDAKKLADELCRDFLDGKFGRLGILYTRYRSMISQEATLLWVLPLEKQEKKENAEAAPLFEPDEQSVLNAAVPTYVSGILSACIKESFASEVAARRMAMDSASKNATEMIKNSTVRIRKLLQHRHKMC